MMKNLIPILSICLSLVISGVIAYFIFNDSETSSLDQKITNESQIVQPEVEQSGVDYVATSSASEIEVSTLGIIESREDLDEVNAEGREDALEYDEVSLVVSDNSPVICLSEECFIKKFTLCEPGQYTSSQLVMGASAYYKIIGPVAGGCSILFKYPDNPNPSWVNKEMTCTYNNKIPFQQSVKSTIDGVLNGLNVCSGPLYEVLKNVSINNNLIIEKIPATTTGVDTKTSIVLKSASYNGGTDSLIFTGTNLLSGKGNLQRIALFADYSSIAKFVPEYEEELLKQKMELSEYMYLRADSTFMTLSDSKVEIKRYGTAKICEFIKEIPELDTKNIKVKAGVSFDDSLPYPQLEFEVTCIDTLKKFTE